MAGETILGVMGNIASTAINNYAANYRTQQDRKENYKYGEMAAENADRRTRALYADFYSPEALMKQYQEAGLSPSMMFGGTPGQGGMSGAQGAGPAGPQTPVYGIDPLVGAQIANIMADTNKKKEETKNITTDTKIKDLELQMSEMTTGQYKTEWEILNSTWTDSETGEATSLYEMAKRSYTYEDFLKDVRMNKDNIDPTIYQETQTETGQKVLRSIYEGVSKFTRDIMILSQETVNANFQIDVLNKLKQMDYANENAEAAIGQLKALKSTSELTETQKEAWNNLIDKLGKKGSTMRDIVVVIGMILSNFASHTGIKVNVGN